MGCEAVGEAEGGRKRRHQREALTWPGDPSTFGLRSPHGGTVAPWSPHGRRPTVVRWYGGTVVRWYGASSLSSQFSVLKSQVASQATTIPFRRGRRSVGRLGRPYVMVLLRGHVRAAVFYAGRRAARHPSPFYRTSRTSPTTTARLGGRLVNANRRVVDWASGRMPVRSFVLGWRN